MQKIGTKKLKPTRHKINGPTRQQLRINHRDYRDKHQKLISMKHMTLLLTNIHTSIPSRDGTNEQVLIKSTVNVF